LQFSRLLALVDAAVIIAKLDRLTRSVKDLCTLLEHFERRGVALVSIAESLGNWRDGSFL
jgi:DNA invertase Pin-like site-specific DNA recombinase